MMAKRVNLPISVGITLLVLAGGSSMGFFAGKFWLPQMFQKAQAVITCDNDGTVDVGETCSNCPYDKRCTAAQKCIVVAGVGTCSGTDWSCKREDICGDGWTSGAEECDDGGICTGSTNASLNGRLCFTLDPAGENIAGVARCRATGGICVAQDNDGCTWDCQTECHESGAPCLLASDCCSLTCTNGTCAAGGGGGAVCGNDIIEAGETCDDGNTTSGDGCSSACRAERQCNDLIDNADPDTDIDCADAECLSSSDWVEYELDITRTSTVPSLRISDLNMDGEMDIVLTEGAPLFISGNLEWYESNGAVPPVFSVHALGGDVSSLDAGLVNDEDTYPDIVTASGLGSRVDWYKNDGAEGFTNFQIPSTFPAQSVLGVHIVDWNNDGQKDVLVLLGKGPDPTSVYLYENNGSESFTEREIVTGVVVNAAHFGDVNGDGRPDIIIGDTNSIDWYRNQATLPFPLGGTIDSPLSDVYSIYAENMDTDSDKDLVASDGTGTRWYQNNGAGAFTRKTDLTNSLRGSLYAADIDEDSDVDVIGAAGREAYAYYSSGGANPTFSAETGIMSFTSSWFLSLRAGDLKNNGDTVVVAGIKEDGSADNFIEWYDDAGTGQCYYLDDDESS